MLSSLYTANMLQHSVLVMHSVYKLCISVPHPTPPNMLCIRMHVYSSNFIQAVFCCVCRKQGKAAGANAKAAFPKKQPSRYISLQLKNTSLYCLALRHLFQCNRRNSGSILQSHAIRLVFVTEDTRAILATPYGRYSDYLLQPSMSETLYRIV